ncbi:hypothetical protein ACIGO9_15130 [Nocardia asteroides]|uniref:hypothetical protein n=1 Tax=Nocardia asteroides TaxID=1824 RepID=UPI0037C4F8A8
MPAPGAAGGVEAMIYEFVIEGLLSATACAAFPELDATYAGQCTRLTGPVADRIAFRSVMNRLDALALAPIAITRLTAPG